MPGDERGARISCAVRRIDARVERCTNDHHLGATSISGSLVAALFSAGLSPRLPTHEEISRLPAFRPTERPALAQGRRSMSMGDKRGLRAVNPPGWPQPKGYANAITGRGRLAFVAGQIGWT